MLSANYQIESKVLSKCSKTISSHEKYLKIQISKFELERIINQLLIDFCEMTVIGYNKNEDNYWCKKYNNNICVMFLKLLIRQLGNNYSEIIIFPIEGDINDFVFDLHIAIKLYKTSKFIKNLIQSN